jgi:hypothetical protein
MIEMNILFMFYATIYREQGYLDSFKINHVK